MTSTLNRPEAAQEAHSAPQEHFHPAVVTDLLAGAAVIALALCGLALRTLLG